MVARKGFLFLINQLEAIGEPNQEPPEGAHQVPSTSAIRKPGTTIVILMYDKMPLGRVGVSKINLRVGYFLPLDGAVRAFARPRPVGLGAWWPGECGVEKSQAL